MEQRQILKNQQIGYGKNVVYDIDGGIEIYSPLGISHERGYKEIKACGSCDSNCTSSCTSCQTGCTGCTSSHGCDCCPSM